MKICPNCGVRFYDLGSKLKMNYQDSIVEYITCPKCGQIATMAAFADVTIDEILV